MAGECLPRPAVVLVLLREEVAHGVGRVAAPLDVDQQRRVPHHVLLRRGLLARVGVNLGTSVTVPRIIGSVMRF